MRIKYTLLFVLCSWIGQVAAQTDTLSKSKGFFALTAEDITRDQKLVESLLNRKTTTAAQVGQFASQAPATVYVISKEQIYSIN